MAIKESQLQLSVVTYLKYMYPKSIVFSVPNGGFRNLKEAAMLKRTGVLAGVSDLIFLHKRAVFFLELKTEKGKQSESQKQFAKLVSDQGHCYMIIKSIDDLKFEYSFHEYAVMAVNQKKN